MPTCLVLNRNYPPQPGVTGYSASLLVEQLRGRGWRVVVGHVDGQYDGATLGQAIREPTERFAIGSLYDGKRPLLRLTSSAIEGWRLGRLILGCRPDLVVAMTDPPMLPLWVGPVCQEAGIPWMYWAMDLYPDAFEASGLVTRANPVYRWLARRARELQPDHLIALGPGQADHIMQQWSFDCPVSVIPCGVHQATRSSRPPMWYPGPDFIVLGYTGNVGAAHESQFIIHAIDSIDPNRQRVILAVYGSGSKRVIEAAMYNPGVVILDSVSRRDLGWIDVHLVSLRTNWDHTCVPSKAVSAICAGGAILACMSKLNDNWGLLGDAGWRIDPASASRTEIAHSVSRLNHTEVLPKRRRAEQLAATLCVQEDTALLDVCAAADGLVRPGKS